MAMPTSGPSFLLPTPGLASPQQHQQQQQQMHMQQPQMMVAPPPVAPPAPIPLDAVTLSVKLATMAGEQFKTTFYNVFDAHRTDLRHFFAPQSVLVWEGTGVQGVEAGKLFEMLPPSKHSISTFDVQGVNAGDVRGGVNCLLVNVTGTVTWGAASAGATPSGFYHSFVLERGQSASGSNKPVHHIVSASFRTRLIDDPTDSAVGHHLKKKRVFTR